MALVNKREILQPMLDKIEAGWSIKKPSPLEPCDVDTVCIFQQTKPGDYRDVKVIIENSLFRNGKLSEIERLVQGAIRVTRK